MKYYLILKNGKYLGYSNEKKFVKRFLKQRKGNYVVHDIHEDDMGKLKDKIQDDFKMLLKMDMGIDAPEVYLFGEEASKFETQLTEMTLELTSRFENLLGIINHIKFSNQEQKIIDEFMEMIDLILSGLIDEHEPNFDEYYKLDKLIKEFLNI